jgi:hypothetical protein
MNWRAWTLRVGPRGEGANPLPDVGPEETRLPEQGEQVLRQLVRLGEHRRARLHEDLF